MLTCCPHCRHRFHVSDAEREAWGGQVRCGDCGQVFDIRTTQNEPVEDLAQPDFGERPRKLNLGAFGVSLQDAEAPRAVARDKPGPGAPDASPEPPRRRPPGNETRDIAPTSVPTTPAMIPAVLKDDLTVAHPPRRSLRSTLAWGLACLFLILALMAQLAYEEREQLLAHPELEPWVRQACDLLGCPLPPRTDPASLHLISRQVHSHPGHPGALMITGRLENRADFHQPWPILEMIFMDIMGNPMAARRFAPETYLVHPPEGLMPPSQPADIRLDVGDPGPAAVSYEFRFLAP
ncbi:zinc-ribbon and DUF3426 domain-containing protein [Ectothiorhodospira lacustris]|uniref:zinc-ribbon and DUF3426 domain-containing protein n=1 Tax=Ectothiorhodospira lacustris TaxID=2899127 RepID=UPI001EE9286F|nr:zinc-ribbon and DUF3426 domain-containing protein [Ectothiorhodospira lacustris]MCG5501525.1 zinc-ribbon and DUF3426 domain-containing protein [Ectothiorhodospira lacustris]MCG5510858.1 zinc-ribbon and DUF3426 domain-containing protein [Ectothiorhodospira lacustris]MCG5522596.1 zinc-ribbon and DUF3426 domain-containing protein [Ectothiorhodospira lacustris]